MYERGNRYLRVLDHPVVFQPEDIPAASYDAGCGIQGIRDSDNPCELYTPTIDADFLGLRLTAPGGGSCDSDGHYLCGGCIHLSDRSVQERSES